MYKILSESREDLVAIQVNDKIEAEDFKTLRPFLEGRIRIFGKLRLYWEMRDFEGWTLDGFWADAGFDSKHKDDFTSIAMVGDKKWQEWMTKLMEPFISAEVKYFDLDEIGEALEWIRRKN